MTRDREESAPRSLPTEADYLERLHRIFDNIEQGHAAMASNTLWPAIERRSNLAKDDQRTKPLQLSSTLQTLIMVALDHQHAPVRLVRRNGEIFVHQAAPFSLSRSAVEAAATALWMLQPTDSWRQRVRRLVIYQRQDRYDYQEVSKLVDARVGGGIPAGVEKRKEQIAAIIGNNRITDLPRKLDMTDVIQAVDAAIDRSQHIETFWRTASAFAHGRQWAVMNALVRQEQPGGADDDLVLVKISSDVGRVFWGAAIAYELTSRALTAYQEAARAPRR